MELPALRLGGITSFTTIDFPGRLAVVLFCQGCPWRCRYCHNPHLLDAFEETPLTFVDAMKLLERRQGLIDGVVFSGGEPTLHRGLSNAMSAVREMGFEVGLHTSGAYPKRLASLLPLVDWVGMDIKAPPARYDMITLTPGSADRAWQSARLLVDSGVDHEFRTTVHPSLLSSRDVLEIAAALEQLGARHYVVQRCVTKITLDPALREDGANFALTAEDFVELRRMIPEFSVRGVDQPACASS
jgi:pyruvate formate lyase activating enzyme